nr:transcriptional regulator [Streptomyces minutiscleroticus]
MLGRLAAERASGVLTRDRGVLYLVDGQVVHAESPATPGLDVLLTAGGTLGSEGWWEAVSQAGAERRVGRFLVDSGRLSAGALELCHLGALYDAAYFTLGPNSGPTRFRYGVAHWIGPVRPVSVAAVERETLRRRALLDRIWPESATDTEPVERTGRRADPSLPPRRRTVLDHVDGERTAAAISLALGRPGFHTLVDLRRLAAAGMVTATVRPAAATPPDARPPADGPPARPVPPPADRPVPRAASDPDIGLLVRLKEALEAL